MNRGVSEAMSGTTGAVLSSDEAAHLPSHGALVESGTTSSISITSDDEVCSSRSGAKPTGRPPHPLERTWSFWLMYQAQTKDKKDNWKGTQKRVLDFTSVEDFWRVFNNVSSPSRLTYADYSVFRQGIAPMWEDETCAKGGRWIVSVDRPNRRGAASEHQKESIDESWVNILLSLIGSAFPNRDTGVDAVCGAVCSVRKYNIRLALWVGTSDKDEVLRLGTIFREAIAPLFAPLSSSAEDNSEGNRTQKLQESPTRRPPSSMSFEYFTKDPSHVALELSLTTTTDDEDDDGQNDSQA
ncbi:translation initiation factor E4, putative [Perkinsus marinus ATCC 50983]|uniref:Translation initiation factor E4, putative n=1 Tax=Perkinsus marinus (strain ATCC 50983 / TXsc) TaxID=423536 RepID=C5KAQ2_PERM5|nr:translation initiation factor E4, putative [Perkinsus marinus ATCC 50983]EER18228.1 translation initiation factor E4, putative [Perkinsus marinus ATCC 50983]|eukprot:XP_002786432.1 translation initiation factor E4, putative [Perkinsus marinus ATCC 50983]